MSDPGPDHSAARATTRWPSTVVYRVILSLSIGLTIVVATAVDADQISGSHAVGVLAGFALMVALTIAVSWQQPPGVWAAVLPFIDLALIAAMQHDAPSSGFELLFTFPVGYLAWTFGRRVGAASVVIATALIWGPIAFGERSTSTAAGAIALPILLTGAAIATIRARERSRRQAAEVSTALQAAHLQQRMTGAVLDVVTFFVLTLDTDGRLIGANRQTRRYMADLGHTTATSLDGLVVYGEDRTTPIPLADRPHARAVAGEDVDDTILWLGAPGQHRMALMVSARRVQERDIPARIVLVGRDITAEVNAIQARDDLVASVSHELRTPITSVLGYVELAREHPDLPAPVAGMLEIAVRNIDRLLEMVDDFISAQREESGRFELVHRPCDLSELVAGAIESFMPRAREQSIVLTATVSERLTIEGDAFRLRQVVDNLLSNAIKYNVRGGRVSVTVTAADLVDGSAGVRIDVADTGRGMTIEEQLGLFRRFYRAESVRRTTIHGSGLGLHIAHGVVLGHGGTIDLVSMASEGTTVSVLLPLRQRTEEELSRA